MNSNVKSILRNILEEYDVNKTSLKKKIGDYHYYKRTYKSKDSMNEISLFNKKKEKVYNSKIQLLGIYMPNIKLWKWGWSLFMDKIDIYMSRKILNYALDIDNLNMLFLRDPLINSNITINNQLELDLLLGISSYLTKQKNIMGFYKVPYNEAIDNFYEVGNLKEKDDIDNYMIEYYILVDE